MRPSTTYVPKNGLKSPAAGAGPQSVTGSFEMVDAGQQQQYAVLQPLAPQQQQSISQPIQQQPPTPKFASVTPLTPITPITPGFIQQPNVQFIHPQQLQVSNPLCLFFVGCLKLTMTMILDARVIFGVVCL